VEKMDNHDYHKRRMPFSRRNIELKISDVYGHENRPKKRLLWFVVYCIVSLLAAGLFVFLVITISGYQKDLIIFQPMFVLVLIILMQTLSLLVFLIINYRQRYK
jgi:energy-coupling factor transporter transmembrane protein EcfT